MVASRDKGTVLSTCDSAVIFFSVIKIDLKITKFFDWLLIVRQGEENCFSRFT